MIGDSIVMASAAAERELFPAFLYVYVADADSAFRRALAAGAVSIEEPRDTPYGDRRAMVPVALVEGRGKFGAALEFTADNSHVLVYKAERNVAYSAGEFSGTASFWLNLDPAAIPGHYSDPFQLTDKKYSDACIWLDFTKNDQPSDFRLGVFGDVRVWDLSNREARGEDFLPSPGKIAEPPFAGGRWTHVVVTWEGVNTPQDGRARLYLNGDYRAGATGRIREPFTWDIANATIRLGMGHFVGLVDDLALFNRALAAAEARALSGLRRGVAELYE
jgi:hypothetical protein